MNTESDITRDIPFQANAGAQRGRNCPDSDLIAAYAEARLAADQQSELEEHLADCSFCLGQVGFLVRDAQRDLPSVPTHLLDAVREPKSHWPKWARKPVLAPLAAAATLIVAAAVVFQLDRLSDSSVPTQSVSDPAVESTSPSTPGRTVRNGTASSDALRILEPQEGADLSGPEIELRWQHSPQSLQYTVLLVSLEGDLMWEGRTTEARIAVPTSKLEAGERYFVWVEAQLPGGGTLKSALVGFHLASG